MSRPTFMQGVVLAGGLALGAGAVVVALAPFLAAAIVARLLIPGLALAYIVYLLARSQERTGRVTVVAVWCAMAVAAWFFIASFPAYLLTHAIAVWLVRSLYFHAGVLTALLDLGLTAFASALTVGVLLRTGSAFLATWCFFLTQALFTAIPAAFGNRMSPHATPANFERASRQADAALRQLTAKS